MWMIMAAYSNQAAIASMLAPSTDGALVNMLGQLSFTGKRRKSGFHPKPDIQKRERGTLRHCTLSLFAWCSGVVSSEWYSGIVMKRCSGIEV